MIKEFPTPDQIRALEIILAKENNSIGGGLLDLGIDVLDPCHTRCLGIELNNVLVAVAVLNVEWAEIHKIFVVPSSRGFGLGLKLFEASLDLLRMRGHEEAFVQVLDSGLHFWLAVSKGLSVQQLDDRKFLIRLI